jgi:tRNA A37 threonylcarbamoyladenosine biosynthesis protein TsaE
MAEKGTSEFLEKSRFELYYLRIYDCKEDSSPIAVPLPKAITFPITIGFILQTLQVETSNSMLRIDEFYIKDPRLDSFRKPGKEEMIGAEYFYDGSLKILMNDSSRHDDALIKSLTLRLLSVLRNKANNLQGMPLNSSPPPQISISRPAEAQKQNSGIFNFAHDVERFGITESPSTVGSSKHSRRPSKAESSLLNVLGLDQLTPGHGMMSSVQQESMSGRRTLDFGFLYSCPLVDVSNKDQSTEAVSVAADPVNFHGECEGILKTLEESQFDITVDVRCATQDGFYKMVYSFPTVLHIMCHGGFNKDFYLCFENKNCDTLMATHDKLKGIVGKIDMSNTKIVFINACHSEGVGKFFLESGADCLIVVKSEHKVNDDFATKFSKIFYREILQGKTITDSFHLAKISMKEIDEKHCETCCCVHEHSIECKWHLEVATHGLAAMHLKHLPTCDCPLAYKRIHKVTCQWYMQFYNDYIGPERDKCCVRDANITLGPSNKNKLITFCCCSPELPHDEGQKMKIIYRGGDSELGKKPLFRGLNYGDLILKNQNYFGLNQYKVEVIGQNKVMYNIIKDLSNNKVVVFLEGKPGCGKTTICRYIYNYLSERHTYNDIPTIVDMRDISNITPIKTAKESAKSSKSLVSKGKFLLIIENADHLLQTNFAAFKKTFENELATGKLHFLITVSNLSVLDGKELPSNCSKHKTLPIPFDKAIKIIISELRPKLTEMEKLQSTHEADILREKIQFTYPLIKRICSDFVNPLTKPKNGLTRFIIDTAKKAGSTQKDEENLELQYKNLDTERMNEYIGSLVGVPCMDLLYFLSCFPNGFLLSHLERILVSGQTLLPRVPGEWLTCLVDLIAFGPEEEEEHMDEELHTELTSLFEGQSLQNLNNTIHELMKHMNPGKLKWFEIKKEKIGENEEYIILPMTLLHSHLRAFENRNGQIENEEREMRLIHLLNALQFHRLMLSSIIKQYKELKLLDEDIVENSAINYSCHWDMLSSDLAILNGSQNKEGIGKYFRDLFKFHESNYRALITPEHPLCVEALINMPSQYLNDLGKTMDGDMNLKITVTGKEIIVDSIEDFFIKVLTLCKEYKEPALSNEFALSIEKLMSPSEAKLNFARLRLKVEMYLAYIIYGNLTGTGQNNPLDQLGQLKYKVSICEELLDNVVGSEADITFLTTDFLILKFYSLKIEEKGYIGMNPDEICKQLRKTRERLIEMAEVILKLSESNPDYMHNWAKTMLVLLIDADTKHEHRHFNEDVNLNDSDDFHNETITSKEVSCWSQARKVKALEEIIFIFKSANSYTLLIKALELICKIMKQNTNPSVQEMSKRFECAKLGVEISKVKQLHMKEKEFHNVAADSIKQIELLKENKFLVLDTSPLSLGLPEDAWRVSPSGLRRALHNKICHFDKNIALTFDHFTPLQIEKLQEKGIGWKLVIINLVAAEEDKFLLETTDFKHKVLNREQLETLLEPRKPLNIEILLLISENTTHWRPFFTDRGIRTILTLNTGDARSRVDGDETCTQYLKDKFRVDFLVNFLHFLTHDIPANDSFRRAYVETLDDLSSHMNACCIRSREKNVELLKMPNSAISLFNQSSIDLEMIKITTEGSPTIKCRLQNGKVADNSAILQPWIGKFWEDNQFSIPRNKEVYDLYQQIRKDSEVILTGEKGLGKTTLAKTLVSELAIRSVYKDGVYYFDLNSLEKNEKIRDAMGKQLGEEFLKDSNKVAAESTFFDGKRCLIVFDGWERVQRFELSNPQNLIKAMHRNRINILYIVDTEPDLQSATSKNADIFQPNQVEQEAIFKMPPLSAQQSLQYLMMLQISNKIFVSLREESAVSLTESPFILDSIGNFTELRQKSSGFLSLDGPLAATVCSVQAQQTNTSNPPLISPEIVFDPNKQISVNKKRIEEITETMDSPKSLTLDVRNLLVQVPFHSDKRTFSRPRKDA